VFIVSSASRSSSRSDFTRSRTKPASYPAFPPTSGRTNRGYRERPECGPSIGGSDLHVSEKEGPGPQEPERHFDRPFQRFVDQTLGREDSPQAPLHFPP
jgi:hypothetical protein